MTNEERLDFAVGQLAALKAFCVTLIATHPRPEELEKVFSTLSEVTVAKTLPTPASDAILSGVRSMTDDLSMALRKASGR